MNEPESGKFNFARTMAADPPYSRGHSLSWYGKRALFYRRSNQLSGQLIMKVAPLSFGEFGRLGSRTVQE